MSLLARKIRKYLETHNVACQDALNAKLGSQFQFDIDWDCLGDVAGWNWAEPDVKKCFYNSYYLLLESGLAKLFADEDYKEAILEQVKTIAFVPGRMMPDYSFTDGVLKITHTMSPNNGGDRHEWDVERNTKGLIETIEQQLS